MTKYPIPSNNQLWHTNLTYITLAKNNNAKKNLKKIINLICYKKTQTDWSNHKPNVGIIKAHPTTADNFKDKFKLHNFKTNKLTKSYFLRDENLKLR